ncbi:PQQ-dependent sugar dehydrogenase [Saccharibacillus alkalitolerans]|uniref:PQQ-dependent sugar dehydrogenase n=1 Tax=Saccharibacillus alkalitolerans TaxID=2705290 RepID=A0ABX0F8N4_9BACL|nr:PQQ-dependent sugar dehydrogenase [Saccharibacillus alkalitolerans]NGZ76750.1 PQQ-dependent sugar dehydrogenase [Saccharibacillus alkalitolerans]
MTILNSKAKMLTASLLLAVPISAYAADQGETEQAAERYAQSASGEARLITAGASGISSAAAGATGVKAAGASLTDSLQGGFDVAATKLKVPWSMQFAGDTVYITQRGGGIVEVKNGKQTVQEVRTKKALRVVGEAGLTGFVLDPNFAKNKYAYIYHAYEEKGEGLNRIVKVKLVNGVWREQKELVDGIPGGRIHEGGRLAIGPDGMLYSTAGETDRRELSQDLSSLGGKVLRMTTSGKIPKDNPFKNSYVYAYGLRNSQGLAWTSSGTLYASDHGPSGAPIPGGGIDATGRDEINVIKPGANYGWPLVIGNETAPGLTPPYYVNGEQAIAPSGIAATPDDKILVATLAGQSLKEFDPIAKTMTDVLTGEGRIRDVAVHNGRIYVLTNNTSGGKPGPDDDRLLILK